MNSEIRTIENSSQAVFAFQSAWPYFIEECRAVLGSEQHYQAMLYHCLRLSGVPRQQLGMNVIQYIETPVTQFGRKISEKRHERFKGFEPTPDAIIFHPRIEGDWRRRRRKETLENSLLSIEMKVSERHNFRLTRSEITSDIEKIVALREEIRIRAPDAPGAKLSGLMIIIETAHEDSELITNWSLRECIRFAREQNILFAYVSHDQVLTP